MSKHDEGYVVDLYIDSYFADLIRFVISAGLTIILGYALSFIPNILDTQAILSQFDASIDSFRAEKSEVYQYLFCSISLPLIFLLLKFIPFFPLARTTRKQRDLAFGVCYLISTFFVTLFLVRTLQANPFSWPGLPLYNQERDVFGRWFIGLFIALLLAAGVLYFLRTVRKGDLQRLSITENSKYTKYSKYIFYFSAIVIILMTGYFFLTDSYYLDLGSNSHHFNAYFYPVYKVYYGQTPLVDFNSLYGYYPYILAPALALLGGATMRNFSILMAILVMISTFCLFYVLKSICRQKMIVILSLLAILYFLVLDVAYDHPGNYYLQYFPHRVISPAVTLALGCAYLNSRFKKTILIVGYIQTTLALLWNLDTGLVCVVAWAAFLIYLKTVQHPFKDKRLFFACLLIIGRTLVSVFMAVSLILLITYVRSGQILLAGLLYGPGIFYGSGFYMLPMPVFHPWLLVGLVYAVALAYAISNMAQFQPVMSGMDERIKNKIAMLFLAAIIGVGIFSYYQGRSHEKVFHLVVWPAFVLLAGLINSYDGVLKQLKRKGNLFLTSTVALRSTVIFILILSFAATGLVMILFSSRLDDFRKIHHQNANVEIKPQVTFLKSHFGDQTDIVYIGEHVSAIDMLLGRRIIAPIPDAIDWFTKDDFKRVLDFMADTPKTIVFDDHCYNLLNKFEKQRFTAIISTSFTAGPKTVGFHVFYRK
jgi:hypothetical protein